MLKHRVQLNYRSGINVCRAAASLSLSDGKTLLALVSGVCRTPTFGSCILLCLVSRFKVTTPEVNIFHGRWVCFISTFTVLPDKVFHHFTGGFILFLWYCVECKERGRHNITTTSDKNKCKVISNLPLLAAFGIFTRSLKSFIFYHKWAVSSLQHS